MQNKVNINGREVLGIAKSDQSILGLPLLNELVGNILYNRATNQKLQINGRVKKCVLIPIHDGNYKLDFVDNISATEFAKYIDQFETELDSITYIIVPD